MLRLGDLHAKIHRGAYRPQPSRRRYIPKADGRQRPLAVAALEDKLVQRATAAVLNQIYEEDFLGFSYGFRPGRGQHGLASKKWRASHEAGGSPCRRPVLRESFRMRLSASF